MKKRLQIIFDNIPRSKTFADIGCDHGYIAKEMLTSNKCDSAVISDISEKCLKKANNLLADYIKLNRVRSVLSDGFNGFYENEKPIVVDTALIAGMGGNEICDILGNAEKSSYPLPTCLVLQPMKNCERVRTFCVGKGYKIVKDFVFSAVNKYYDLLVLVKGKDTLTEAEIKYGRDNLKYKSADFINRLTERKKILNSALESQNISEESKKKIIDEIGEINDVIVK